MPEAIIPDRQKRKKITKPLPDSIPVEVVELPVEAIAESIPVIEQAIAPEVAPIIQQELPKPKGKYNTEFYKSIGIPICSFCGEKECHACPENKHDCPMLLAKPVN